MAAVKPFSGNFLSMFAWLVQHAGVVSEVQKLYSEFASITDPPSTQEGLKKRVSVAVRLAALGASLTETQTDDQAVAALGVIAQDETLLGIIAGVIGQFDSDELVHANFASLDDAKAAAGRLNIPWDKLLKLLPTILSILALFAEKPKG